jgi:hypothetical protein
MKTRTNLHPWEGIQYFRDFLGFNPDEWLLMDTEYQEVYIGCGIYF